MSQKVDMDELVNAAITTELACEIYAVSVIAINDVEEAERTIFGIGQRIVHKLNREF